MVQEDIYGIWKRTGYSAGSKGAEIEQIRDFLGLDYLGYLSLEGLVAATQMPHHDFCLACFSGDYPVALEGGFSKTCFEEEVCSQGHSESILPPACSRR